MLSKILKVLVAVDASIALVFLIIVSKVHFVRLIFIEVNHCRVHLWEIIELSFDQLHSLREPLLRNAPDEKGLRDLLLCSETVGHRLTPSKVRFYHSGARD